LLQAAQLSSTKGGWDSLIASVMPYVAPKTILSNLALVEFLLTIPRASDQFTRRIKQADPPFAGESHLKFVCG
jgi:hypothetical protein